MVNIIQSGSGDGGGDRVSDIKVIDMKAMNPKSFDGRAESPFTALAKKVRAYCNASWPGFRKVLMWVETSEDLCRCDWKFKGCGDRSPLRLLAHAHV